MQARRSRRGTHVQSRHVKGGTGMSLALLFVGTAAAFAAGIAVIVVALTRA
jgi:hypothetical protein